MTSLDEYRALMQGEDLFSLAELLNPPEWHEHAACKGESEVFFPTRGEDGRPAKAVCASCPVVDDCRDYALDNVEKHGIWGGMAERERRRVRKSRNAERRAA